MATNYMTSTTAQVNPTNTAAASEVITGVTFTNTPSFTGGAAGSISRGGANAYDWWTINDSKVLTNVRSGI
jgi:hypothetical protein